MRIGCFICLFVLFGCSYTKKETNAVISIDHQRNESPTETDTFKIRVNMVLESYGFRNDYSENKYVGYETPISDINGIKREIVKNFIRGLNLDVDLTASFNIDNGFYPSKYGWDGDELILEYVQVGEILYCYRHLRLNLKSKSIVFYDLFSNDDIGHIRVTNQLKNIAISYNIFSQPKNDGNEYQYEEIQYNLKTGDKKLLSKDTVITSESIDSYFGR